MRKEVHPHTATKIIAVLDVAASLAVEQVGMTLQLSALHPLILGSIAGATYALLRHGDTISYHLVNMPDYLEEAFKKYPLSGD